MIEKINKNKKRSESCKFYNGYFKPSGTLEKRRVHKKMRKTHGCFSAGIMNKIGVSWEWC